MEHQWHTLIRNLVDTGMTQTQVARAIGVTQGAVSQVLNSNGRRGFGFSAGNALIKLCYRRGLVTRGDLRSDAHLIWPDVPQARGKPNSNSPPESGHTQEVTHV